ncbi:PIN domain-like protein [Pterulicium gracile]|uniref:Flap endonuclease 1 n=1 Tax=Pterulicium gracile TaxID=1884261 RepID=A0A5C3QPL2_9AGAR|nr:PIN domain-like protein [Pterula gracilis]
MGIKGLTGLISEHAPQAIKEHEIKTLFGRKVAIDASMSIYQFLIAVRQQNGEVLTNDAGETTSHLMGFFYRTIRIVENGIKPAYVFDGKPPELKAGVLKDRFAKRAEAAENVAEAKETGTVEELDKFSRRTVRVTREHNEECRRLLKLMGIPVVIAPSEAEAQCAELARSGKVYAAGSEDMDTLTFKTPILYRHLTTSEARKQPILEVNLEKALEGLEMDMETFIELCILLGCDYLDPIKGVGPKSALKLIRDHGNLKNVMAHLQEKAAEKRAAAGEEAAEEAEAAVEEEEAEDDEPKDDPEPETDADLDEHMATSEFAPSSPPRHELNLDSSDDEDAQPAPPKKPKAECDDEDAKPAAESDDEDQPAPPKGKGKGKAKAEAKPKAEAKGKKDSTSKKGGVKRTGKKAKGGIQVPEHYPWEEAKQIFMKPDVQNGDEIELEWKNPDVDGLVQFLVTEKGFNEDRVRKGAEKLTKFLNAKQQGRLDGFFSVKPKDQKEKPAAAAKGKGVKRKGDEKDAPKKGAGAKKAKTKK